jgi:hypothetical protein
VPLLGPPSAGEVALLDGFHVVKPFGVVDEVD